ncbi:murein biosynthesis integral membrane protein MurJ [endosymbiont of Pachyrhynchus infernalis]|uniref:murein biosynthesis integral membrane protein MurJ n=1 Tax=endosymbiont of Pachyrhynchus infernalis TaxID=1971488 RepID=UPI000DC73C94|nr:murein biosynthesis integral membrane protein MurJ [endosymbiont of Pachyrhynchus infernalis]BBA84893.1 putative lipid II flippase MurJ [endosymbiont of Pachyrhynchus infernalis]
MNIIKNLVLIGITTSLSRTLGFVRDVIIARMFGASDITDSFFISFKLINFLRKILIEGSFFQVFIPILSEYKKNKNINEIKDFLSCTIGLIMLLLIIITIIGILFSPTILKIFAPNINSNIKFNLTNKIFRIIFPYIIISTLSMLVSSVLNMWDNFIVPSLSLSFINIIIILFSIFSNKISNPPILSLAWSILIGNIFQLIYQLKYINDIDMIIIPTISLKNSGLKKLINNIWLALLSTSINQISMISNTIFTSFLPSGSISWMYYADKIIEFPSGIIISTLNTILLPYLSKSAINNDKNEYSKFLDIGLRLSILISLPITIILIVLSKLIIFSIFKYGKFSYFDALMTSQSLIAYSIGLIGIILVKILTPSFYSYQDNVTPLKISIITFIITQILNFIFITTLKHIGLSLSIGLSACFNSLLLYIYLIKNNLFKPKLGWKKFIYKIVISSINMLLILIIFIKILNYIKNNLIYRLLKLIFLIAIGIITYILSLKLFNFNINDII